MAWYWEIVLGWVIFNIAFVLAAWLRSVITGRPDRSASGSWEVEHLAERLVRQFHRRPWPTFASRRGAEDQSSLSTGGRLTPYTYTRRNS